MSTPITKNTRLATLINHRLAVSTIDGRTYTGQLLAFDKHTNIVLADTEESRLLKKSFAELARSKGQAKVPEEKRVLGLVILRGEQVVSVTVKSGPTSDVRRRIEQLKKGTGTARPIKKPVSRLQGPKK